MLAMVVQCFIQHGLVAVFPDTVLSCANMFSWRKTTTICSWFLGSQNDINWSKNWVNLFSLSTQWHRNKQQKEAVLVVLE